MIEGMKIGNKYRSEFWFLTPTGLHVYRIIESEIFLTPEGSHVYRTKEWKKFLTPKGSQVNFEMILELSY